MQKIRRIIVCYLLFLSIWYSALGQEYQIKHWSQEDGLSNSTVTDILQDRYGFVWIATAHGLNRFDGHQFETFRYHPLDSFSIGGNHIKDVIETEDGTIWAILSIGGLAKWHRNDETFSYYNHFAPFAKEKKIVHVTGLVQTGDEEYLIGTHNGLFVLNKSVHQPQLIYPSPEDSTSIPIYRIHLDQKNRLWMSTADGIQQYDLTEKKTLSVPFYHPGEDSLMQMRSSFNSIFEDSKGRLWVGTQHSGIFQYDEQTNVLHGHWRQLDPTLSQWQNITSIFQTQDDVVWCNVVQHGLFYYDETAKAFQRFASDPDLRIDLALKDASDNIWILANATQIFRLKGQEMEAFNLPNQSKDWISINDLFIDHNGGLWIASSGKGVWHIAKKKWAFHTLDFLKEDRINPSKSSYVTAILQDSKKNFWIGTKMGLIKGDSSLHHFKLYTPNQIPSQTLAGYYIATIMEDHLGRIWVGTSDGISVLDQKSNWVKNYRHNESDPESLSYPSALVIVQDYANRIWVATNNGLNLYKPETDGFKLFKHQADNLHSLAGNDIRQITPSKTPDVLWVGLTGAGLNRVHYFPEKDSISCEHFFFESAHQHSQKIATINTLYEDKNRQLWVGAYSMGFLKFDSVENRLINAQPQIPTIPNIASILEDEQGQLWIAANNGLWQYKPEGNTFRQFTHKNGLSGSQFNYKAACKALDGRLFFANLNGLDFFQPTSIGIAPEVAPPIIYGFRKYDQNIRFEQPIYELSKIVLNYKDNYIHFDFLSPEFQHPEDVQYAYQLDGFDQEWHYCKNPGQANYTNLPGGTYILNVKAGNSEGWWNPNWSSLEIVVIPPFWQRLWFKTSSILLALLLLFLFFRLRWALKMQQINEVAKIREKAAADFHDELGHRLTKISLFSETLLRVYPKTSQELKPYLEKIKRNSDELYHSLRDFVWVMNPRKDSLFELAILLKDFGDELFDNTGIDFRVEGICDQLKAFNLDMDWKRHLVLIFKEAMHNSLKHSHCKNVTLQFSIEKQDMEIKLTDDGTGFVQNEKKQGYGVGNMQNRAKKIGGALSINGLTGTCVKFKGTLLNA